jgi:hypothetical protein
MLTLLDPVFEMVGSHVGFGEISFCVRSCVWLMHVESGYGYVEDVGFELKLRRTLRIREDV